MTLSELRTKWIETEYDAIMTNGPGDFVWESLKQSAASMTEQDFKESLMDSLEMTEEDFK